MTVSEEIFNENYLMFLGQYTAISRIREYAQKTYFTVVNGQRKYFFRNTGLDLSEQQILIIDTLDNAMHKFLYGSISLEQLWGVTHHLENGKQGLPKTIDNGITIKQNEIIFLLSYLLDQALYSWRSFLDFYLKYLLLFVTGRNELNISTKKFMDNFQNYMKKYPNDKKASEVFSYINENVLNRTFNKEYGKECWGDLLRSLRDKTTHNKLIMPTIKKKENLHGFIISWPTIREINFAELAQTHFGNKADDMVHKLYSVLYNVEWKQ